MKFRELHFPAFGPFTDLRLDFESGPGLHLIYGPNESGKSSALRAVRGLLYGISDGRDEFLHPAENLRLKARLERADGGTLEFGRRKGRGKKTLLDAEGKPQDPLLLEGYLGGVDAELFDRLYGLDHRTLSEGGKALLQEGGRVGESLFTAGLGPGFRQVRDALRDEADKLWKKTSRSLAVDKAIELYRAAQKRAADLSVSAEGWRKLSAELAEEERKAHALEAQIRELEVARQRLKRYQDAHAPLSQREHLSSVLAELGELPALANSFSERRQATQAALKALRHQLARVRDTEGGLTRRLQELPEETGLMPYAHRIDRLHRSLDAVAEAEAALPVTRARGDAVRRRLASQAADLGLGSDPTEWGRLPDASQRARARRLAERYRRLKDELATRQAGLGSLARLQETLEERAHRLGAPRATTELEASLRRLRMALGADTEIAGVENALVSKEAALQGASRGLPYWSGTVEELEALTIPELHRLADFERREVALQDRLKEVDRELKSLEQEGKKTKSELEQLKEREKVPSRDDLLGARRARAQAWEGLLKAWERGERPAGPASVAMERALRDTDQLADRLLDDASRVSEFERLKREYEVRRQEWPQLNKLKKDRQAELAALQQAWRDLWSSERLAVGSTAEMRAWLPRRETVLALAVEVRQLRERLAQARHGRAAQLESHAATWREPLGEDGLGSTVTDAIERAETVLIPLLKAVDEQRRLGEEETQLRANLSETEAALASVESGLQAWRAEWSEVAAAFHREATADPTDLESLLDRYEELRGLLDEQDRATRDFEEQTAQIDVFRQQVGELAVEVGEGEAGEDLAAFIERLVSRLAVMRRDHTVRQQLSEQLESLSREFADLESQLRLRETEWASLLKEAATTDPEALPALEAAVARRRQVVERMRDIETSLRPLLGSQSLEQFSQSLAGLDWDAVPGQVRDLDRQLESLDSERNRAWQRKGQLEQELSSFDASEQAAAAAQEAAEAMAEGKASVARYARLALAEAVLKREMERYRRENEGPVLRAASRWFQSLTCGAYTGLTTGLDPKDDTPRLEAVAASGRHVPVEGLSDGTRDQLFLALRLATIDQSLDGSSEAMPMIMDDVLVHFDTERARATLQVLAEFAERTQILLFTHLERDKLLAEALPAQQAVVVNLQPLGL